MIYVNMDDPNRDMGIEYEGNYPTIMSDISMVLFNICEEGDHAPEEVIEDLKRGFLEGCNKLKEDGNDIDALINEWIEEVSEKLERGVKADVKDERSKEAVQSPSRRARRRLH